MRHMFGLGVLLVSLVLTAGESRGQGISPFDVTAYAAFLAAHKDMSPAELLGMHPAGKFARTIPLAAGPPRRLDSIDMKYFLTTGEKLLLNTNGFLVTERVAPASFGAAFLEIWRYDLPVFISTDAILHALHMSYDDILTYSEEVFVIPKLTSILSGLHGTLPSLHEKYRASPGTLPSLMDLDLFLTVARNLLDGAGTCYYPENAPSVATILQNIDHADLAMCAPLFGDSIRTMDFSQFTVRGHYTRSQRLSRYFQAMMWLGRTEFYLSPPNDAWTTYRKPQIQRQAVAACLFAEASAVAGKDSSFRDIDDLLGFFVGEPDNVTMDNLRSACADAGVTPASALLDTNMYNAFHDTLRTRPWASQRILSQILEGDLFTPGGVRPPSSFLPMGQRFVIDSYVSGQVVYDRISYHGLNVWRELPAPLDIMFALGNDAAAQLLVPELEKYHYATNLTALRYLIDSYEPQFWNGTFFNGWLNALRALNPPRDRAGLPPFMNTAGWWQEKMNTQLASWAQLRHDNILYSKQSYTGGATCSYPCGYVEPIPLFYARMDTLMRSAASHFRHAPAELQWFSGYFDQAARTCSTLAGIAKKEVERSPLSDAENFFLTATMYGSPGGYGSVIDGWYPHLFFSMNAATIRNLVVADVHTCPTDASGAYIGWVLHVGTGPVNMAVVIADVPDTGPSAYVGPVMSYYQRVTTDFKRLTDEEWDTEYANGLSVRPPWVNAYLADKSGNLRPAGDMLLTDVSLPTGGGALPSDFILFQNYPNPFNPSTQVHFGLREAAHVRLEVYDLIGRRVAVLVDELRAAGVHAAAWDGRNGSGIPVASGVYLSRIVLTTPQGTQVYDKTNRMMLMR